MKVKLKSFLMDNQFCIILFVRNRFEAIVQTGYLYKLKSVKNVTHCVEPKFRLRLNKKLVFPDTIHEFQRRVRHVFSVIVRRVFFMPRCLSQFLEKPLFVPLFKKLESTNPYHSSLAPYLFVATRF